MSNESTGLSVSDTPCTCGPHGPRGTPDECRPCVDRRVLALRARVAGLEVQAGSVERNCDAGRTAGWPQRTFDTAWLRECGAAQPDLRLLAMYDGTGRRGIWYSVAPGTVELRAGREGDDVRVEIAVGAVITAEMTAALRHVLAYDAQGLIDDANDAILDGLADVLPEADFVRLRDAGHEPACWARMAATKSCTCGGKP